MRVESCTTIVNQSFGLTDRSAVVVERPLALNFRGSDLITRYAISPGHCPFSSGHRFRQVRAAGSALIPPLLIDLFAFIANCRCRSYRPRYYKGISRHTTGGSFSRDNIYRDVCARASARRTCVPRRGFVEMVSCACKRRNALQLSIRLLFIYHRRA